MRDFILALFAVAGGLTISGIAASLYRLVSVTPQGRVATWGHYGVMLLAGPSILLENATRSFRKRECSRAAFAFALGLAAYWSFMLGLVAMEVGLAI